ncbi:DUF5081 family protein [Clostridium brassicae]|uniref:DUF5081 family protein n=1 Tax=Clostridium brassicae TaxID=2999072 RepID=A0ABT4D7I0_9CLOT|nr:DUF5081 family protein [Clostridium brassicae]MCY6957196.1 DUF5081 family protein [Clostridium brassicae]
MISASELYYLNRALDGTPILGINPVETLINNDECEDSPKESLIRKKILESNDRLNEKSFRIINDLEKYKKAKKHIWINDLLIAIDETDFLIFLKNSKKGQVIIERTIKSLMLCEIIKKYQFLWNSTKVEDGEKEIIKPNDFILNKLLDKKENEVLCIQKKENESFSVCNIYYKEDYVYKYDLLNKQLTKINPRDIRLELANIFELRVSK